MAVKTQGQAGTSIDFLDFSFLSATGQLGIVALQGITERGEISKPQLVSTWTEFQEKFGGTISTSKFPLLVKNFLELGGKALISPVGHYLDINDKSTLLGTKATSTISEVQVADTQATATITIDTVGTDLAVVTAKADYITIGTYAIQASDTPTLVATGLASAINSGTGTHGFSASGAVDVVTVTAPVGRGSSINGIPVVAYTADGTGTYTLTNFTGGISAANTADFTFEAKEIGSAYNSVFYQVVPAANGATGQFDLQIGIDGYPSLNVTVSNIPATLTSAEVSKIANSQSLLTIADGFTGDLRELPKTYLTGGVKDDTQIVVQDYIGTQIGGTGLYSFDDNYEFVKLACPAVAFPELDAAMVAYAEQRKDHLAAIRVPEGITSQGWIDYREGEGAYSHAAIDNWRAFITAGGLVITDPDTLVPTNITEAASVLGLISNKDNENDPWISAAGQKRGRITNALDVQYNLGSPARVNEADRVSIHGINTVINHESYGVVFWDNVTLSKDNSLFKFLNVAELLIYLYRTIKPITDGELFDPNDITTWKTIFRKVDVVMSNVRDNRGIYNFRYEGDQDIDTVEQATVNTSQSISNGQYIFNLYFQPTPAMKFVGMQGIVTNAGVDFSTIEV